MLDLKFIRDNTDIVRKAIAVRHDNAPIDEIIELDIAKRQKMALVEEIRCERKNLAKTQGADSAERGRELRDRIKTIDDELRDIDSRLEDLLLRVPNIPQDSVPIGDREDDNIVISTCGEMRKFDFIPAPHWELGERLGIIDFERGVRLSGTRFYVLKGLGSRLQRSLINFMLNLHTEEHGYREAYLPYMVKKECLVGSSNLPKFADNLYVT